MNGDLGEDVENDCAPKRFVPKVPTLVNAPAHAGKESKIEGVERDWLNCF